MFVSGQVISGAPSTHWETDTRPETLGWVNNAKSMKQVVKWHNKHSTNKTRQTEQLIADQRDTTYQKVIKVVTSWSVCHQAISPSDHQWNTAINWLIATTCNAVMRLSSNGLAWAVAQTAIPVVALEEDAIGSARQARHRVHGNGLKGDTWPAT